MDCPDKKIQYETEDQALQALVDHRARFNHPDNSGPVNVYKCSICEFWHFTSRGEAHSALKDLSTTRKLDLLREAYDWERKLR